MLHTDVEKQVVPEKPREDQEMWGQRICDVTLSGMAKLKMNKKLGRGYKVHLDFILTAKRHYWRISKSQELVFSYCACIHFTYKH